MEKKKNLKFKKSESFYIRDGWFEKALNTISDSEDLYFFAKNKGIERLGIGSNMVKGLRYWLQAASLVSTNIKTEILPFGKLVLQYDRYFESEFTWFLVHYFLCKNYNDCPIFYAFFNSNISTVKKSDLIKYLHEYFSEHEVETKQEYIEDDVSVFLKTYINDEKIINPEENYVCPLSDLKLIRKRGDKIEKNRPSYSSLSHLIVYFALTELYPSKNFNIEDSFDVNLAPMLIFNLDKNMYLQYLEEMRKNGLVTINKTAGLNTVYFDRKILSLADVFKLYFRGQ